MERRSNKIMKNKLYLMVGCPGSGKTTYAKKHFSNAVYISRDEIRFDLVSENEEYFSKEDEVFKIFINKINEGLRESLDVVVDATHLNPKSRFKLLACLNFIPGKTQVNVIYMKTPLAECIIRNENRKGTRSYVPPSVIIRMFKALKKPNFEECMGIIDRIIIVDKNEHVKVIEKE